MEGGDLHRKDALYVVVFLVEGDEKSCDPSQGYNVTWYLRYSDCYNEVFNFGVRTVWKMWAVVFFLFKRVWNWEDQGLLIYIIIALLAKKENQLLRHWEDDGEKWIFSFWGLMTFLGVKWIICQNSSKSRSWNKCINFKLKRVSLSVDREYYLQKCLMTANRK